MPRHKQNAPKGTIDLRILRDGVFPSEDARKDEGDIALNVPEQDAKRLIEAGHAKPL
jgi:hypothetical protein